VDLWEKYVEAVNNRINVILTSSLRTKPWNRPNVHLNAVCIFRAFCEFRR